MADVYKFKVTIEVTIATHSTQRECRDELLELFDNTVSELSAMPNPMGAIDSAMQWDVKVKEVQE